VTARHLAAITVARLSDKRFGMLRAELAVAVLAAPLAVAATFLPNIVMRAIHSLTRP